MGATNTGYPHFTDAQEEKMTPYEYGASWWQLRAHALLYVLKADFESPVRQGQKLLTNPVFYASQLVRLQSRFAQLS
jgi:hypothetical protein